MNSITDEHGQPLSSYELEPLLITGLSEDANRTKRRLLTYDEIPPNLVHAVIAIEDRRFFEHSGVDYVRADRRAAQRCLPLGTATRRRFDADQQLARGFFLTPERTYSSASSSKSSSPSSSSTASTSSRSSQMYANEIPLGQLGSFSIDGFGEASQAYFGKDVRQLDLAECALAGRASFRARAA